MERRRLQSVIVALAIVSMMLPFGTARAIDQRNEIVIAQLKYKGGDFEPYTTHIRRLASYMVSRSSVNLSPERKIITVDNKELFYYPLLYMAGSIEFKPFSEDEIKRLKTYLAFGGTLLIDDSSGISNSGFNRSVMRLLERIYPDRKLEKLDDDHTIFRSFYLFNRVPGRKLVSPFLYGVNIDDVTPVIYSKNDLGGAFAGDDFGGWEMVCTPGGDRQREMSFRLGINIVMYALTVNYKRDQIHIPFILQRRK